MKTKSLMAYAFFPGFKSRFRDLFMSGFQFIPYFIALVYGAVRLLPANHPYLNSSNIGRFGVRHVIAEAANNIVLSRNNIDQIILFVSIMVGVVLVVLQIGLLLMALFIQPVSAAMPTNFAGFFLTPPAQEAQDIAGIMLDLVFGAPSPGGGASMFESCVASATPCQNTVGGNINASIPTVWALEPGAFPLPVHAGLHQLFQFYNLGLTVVAVFITIYFMITVVAETAQSGTPFGKRFNKVWAPIRIVVAFGLLIPVGVGYNASQYIVLYAAKFGSGFATNGWNMFNDTLSASYGGAVENLTADYDASGRRMISQPNIPEVGTLLQFMYTARTCAEVERIAENLVGPDRQVHMYAVRDPSMSPAALRINPGTSYSQLINFANGSSQIILRFGQLDPKANSRMMGYVSPKCGELAFRLSDARPEADQEPGVRAMQQYYLFILKELWHVAWRGSSSSIPFLQAENFPLNTVRKTTVFNNNQNDTGTDGPSQSVQMPGANHMRDAQDFYAADVREAMTGFASYDTGSSTSSTGILGSINAPNGALELMTQSGRWATDPVLRNKGWAGAGIWYNRIAELNGAFTSSVLNIPMPTRYPAVMEFIYAKKRQSEENVSFKNRFDPASVGQMAEMGDYAIEIKKAKALWKAFDDWQRGDGVTSTHTSPTGNAIVDIINALFGTEGLFSMRRNADVHPLAQITGVGRALVEGSVRNLTYAAVGGASSALLSIVDQFTGATVSTFSSFLITFAMIGLTAGFVLFYIVPFLPFIYFFFAVGSWVKGIFEAMVGAPLWALAHIRIDGDGLAGKAAVSGYFLVFEVFLRPILIIFGLLASISIFSALVAILNQIFDLVVANMAGFDVKAELGSTNFGSSKLAEMRSALDEFFFTIIYTVIVYLMGMSSFKLVDLIPNNILRWMGQSVSTFGDQAEDSGQSLVGTSTIGAQQTLGALGGGLQKLTSLGGR